MKKTPKITVVIAAYDSQRTIEKCLLSIKGQTYSNIDIVVVDSLFYDEKRQKECKNIIEKYARYFQDGPERSIQRNRGIREAKGEYILTIDQDMYLTDGVVKECYDKLKNENYIALTIPEISIGEGYWTKCVALERYISTVLEEGMNECCRFYRRKDALDIGGYDIGLVGIEDSDFHYRMKKKGKVGKIKSIIYHDEGRTSFIGRIKKKYYYSRAFHTFIRKNPRIATEMFFPIRKAYFKHWELLIKEPLITIGIIVLRAGEVSAGALGILLNSAK